MIEREYSPLEFNIYPFHFSDGDNWGGEDTKKCIELLRTKLLPASNMFCYGQVKSAYGSGQFIKDLKAEFEQDDRLITSQIDDRDDIYSSIKTFLGKGR